MTLDNGRVDAFLSALDDAGMEIVYCDQRELAMPVYAEAGSDALEVVAEGLRRAQEAAHDAR